MTQERRDVDVSKELVRFYMDRLCPTIDLLIDAKKRISQEYENLNLGGGGFSKATIVRALNDGKATRSFAFILLKVLRTLIIEAHTDPDSPYTPENLPELLSLNDPVPDVPISGKNIPIESTSDITALSAFQCMHELARMIKTSDKTYTLYASITTGWLLRCLMESIADSGTLPITRLIVRGINSGHLYDNTRTGFDRKHPKPNARDVRRSILFDIHLLTGLDIDFAEWGHRSLFYGYMYGKKTIFFGNLYRTTVGYEPVLSKMYRVIDSGGDPFFNRLRDLLVDGDDTGYARSIKMQFTKHPDGMHTLKEDNALVIQTKAKFWIDQKGKGCDHPEIERDYNNLKDFFI